MTPPGRDNTDCAMEAVEEPTIAVETRKTVIKTRDHMLARTLAPANKHHNLKLHNTQKSNLMTGERWGPSRFYPRIRKR